MAFLLQIDAGLIFLSLVLSWLLTGLAKGFFSFRRKDRKSFIRECTASGGMPSQHSALVVSVTTMVFLLEGFSSLFVISFTFAVIVMYDSMRVRYAVGEHAKLLNELAKEVKLKTQLPIVKGHTPKEVFYGMLVGILSAGIIFLIV